MAEGRAERAGAPRWMKGLLAVSLALNLAVVGLVAGVVLRDGPDGRSRMVRDLGFGPFTEALAPEDRAALRRAFVSEGGDLRAERDRIREETAGVVAALRADPFDADRFARLLAAQAERRQARLDLGQRLLVAQIAAMAPAARAALADRLEAPGGEAGHGAGHGREGHGRGEDRPGARGQGDAPPRGGSGSGG
jgi:uncharacterized membrane protein